MRLSKRVILWAYTAGVSRPQCGAEHDSDPDRFVVWVYLGLFGFALGWSRDGWIRPAEITRERAEAILAAAPSPQVQTAAFLDEWDRLDAEPWDGITY